MASNVLMNMQVIRQHLQIRMPLSAQPHLMVFHGFRCINEHASDQAIFTVTIRVSLSAQPHLLVFHGFKCIIEHASDQAILTDSNAIISATSYSGIPWF